MSTPSTARTSTDVTPPRQISPLEALRKRWWLAVALPVVLGLLGYLAGLAKAPTYTAEARVAVGAGNLTSGAIAGFPEAAGTLAANYARYVNSSGVTDSQVSTEGVTLSATPIPDSYVISILGEGTDQQRVVAATQRAADQLVKTVNDGRPNTSAADTLAQYQKLSAQWANAKAVADSATATVGRLNGRAGEAEARRAAAQAQAQVANLQVQMDALSQKYAQQISQSSTDANLSVVRKADITASTKSGTAQQYLLGGVALGALLALALAWFLERRPRTAPTTSPTTKTVTSDAKATTAASERPAARTTEKARPATQATTDGAAGATKADAAR